MPHIGKRMVKTAVAVYLCFCIDLLRNGQGIVLNAVIAAVLCMQQSVHDSREVGWYRIIGTFIGGIAGVIFVLVENPLVPENWLLLHYLLVSLCIIPVIYITVYFRWKSSAQLACVVFLCVAVVQDTGLTPVLFAVNRMLDTIIGVGVAIVVNHTGFLVSREKKPKLFFPELENTKKESTEKTEDNQND